MEIVITPRRSRRVALDEKKAYCQVPILPYNKRHAVVAAVDPKTKRYKDFLMNSHSFGFTSAVYNYNRRPLSLQYILVKIFRVPADFYFDDRFGFEPKRSKDRSDPPSRPQRKFMKS